MASLNILHVLRAPVGGLFRHVLDLTKAQIARGHRVGLIAALGTGGERADAALRAVEPSLALGLTRIAMSRQPGPGDVFALGHVMRRIADAKADLVHGHGAKGGAYARLALGTTSAARAYTPHGGSLLFSQDTLSGKFYLTTEHFLMRRGDLYLFESAFSAEMFKRKIGAPNGLIRIVHNGVTREEFEPVTLGADATDMVFMGELRLIKGIDLLIDAIASLRKDGRDVTATLIGDGPDRDGLHAQVERLGLNAAVRFKSAMPARQAQALGTIMVVPSRAESLPYVVLEAAASGKPLIATNVGGIPEIYGPLTDTLVPPNNAPALAQAIGQALDRPDQRTETARKLRERVSASFSVENMVDGVLEGYSAALEKLRQAGRR